MSTENKAHDNKARRALVWSLASGVLSAVLALVFFERYEQELAGGERVLILRARKPIARGEALSDDALVTASVPSSYLEGRAVRAADRGKVRGLRIASALETEDALLWSDLAVSQQRRELSSLVQPGNRAVSVQAAFGDDTQLIRPGDYVDVLATLQPRGEDKLVSALLLQRILVLAVGSITDPQQARADAAGELTLSLKIEEAQLLALARERGKLSVMLRQPDDTRIVEGAPEMAISSLFDVGFRNDLQLRRSPEQRPTKLAAQTGAH
jgi:pilus assembly protein CpaB